MAEDLAGFYEVIRYEMNPVWWEGGLKHIFSVSNER